MDTYFPKVPLQLLERLEQDALQCLPSIDAPEAEVREYLGELRAIRMLRLRYNEQTNPTEE